MLRRVGRVLRGLLLTLGVLLLAWTPVSFMYIAALTFGPSGGLTFIGVKDGAVWFGFMGSQPSLWTSEISVLFDRNDYIEYRRALLPANESDPNYALRMLTCPLWLLAFLCLAWPVTSFIIHRRQHKRGFPVEPKGAGDSVNTSAS